MQHPVYFDLPASCRGVALALALAVSGAHADGVRVPAAPTVYAEECATCHIAFPPTLLTAPAWNAILKDLGQHYGADAAVEPAALKAITAHLLGNAATDASRFGPATRSPAEGLPRMTRTAWFERKHQARLPADVWRNPKVKAAANCEACHAQASHGRFSESDIAVPGYPGRHW